MHGGNFFFFAFALMPLPFGVQAIFFDYILRNHCTKICLVCSYTSIENRFFFRSINEFFHGQRFALNISSQFHQKNCFKWLTG